MTAVAESLVCHVDLIDAPGANRSTQIWKLRNAAARSSLPEAPTVIASGTLAGEWVHGLGSTLSPATVYTTPEAIDLVTAPSRVALPGPLKLMFATAGLTALRVTQFTPATACDTVPLPRQPSTRTEWMRAPLATPWRVPAAIPATCVPCPLQSVAGPPGVTASNPVNARPPKSVWVRRTPVSRM